MYFAFDGEPLIIQRSVVESVLFTSKFFLTIIFDINKNGIKDGNKLFIQILNDRLIESVIILKLNRVSIINIIVIRYVIYFITK